MNSDIPIQFQYSVPTISDGAAVAELVRNVGSLEANTSYCYLLLCSHFASTCVVARQGGKLVGTLLGYQKPAQPQIVFLWQVGCDQSMRGKGLAGKMLSCLRDRLQPQGVTHFELTIAPSNAASWALFRGWARRNDLTLTERSGFSGEHFGGEHHEEETLVSIGPF